MKKTLIIVAVIITILCVNKQDTIIIPKESIRFRVIANSNNQKDQMIKEKVVSKLKNNLKDLTYTPKNINDTRQSIEANLPKIKEVIEDTLKDEVESYTINYGYNYFPEKSYKGIYYEEGNYESLVITLGKGIGENFWCVLFPPLCLIDEEYDEVEYTSFIKELIDKYF